MNNFKLIQNLIIKTFKNDNFDFEYINIAGDEWCKVVINNNKLISILPDSKWLEVKRHINIKLKNEIKDCNICFNKIKTNITCNKCANNWCSDCYINLYITGKGIVSCPMCRYKTGERLPKWAVDFGVEEIKYKLNLN
jgi:hypothetical protein